MSVSVDLMLGCINNSVSLHNSLANNVCRLGQALATLSKTLKFNKSVNTDAVIMLHLRIYHIRHVVIYDSFIRCFDYFANMCYNILTGNLSHEHQTSLGALTNGVSQEFIGSIIIILECKVISMHNDILSCNTTKHALKIALLDIIQGVHHVVLFINTVDNSTLSSECCIHNRTSNLIGCCLASYNLCSLIHCTSNKCFNSITALLTVRQIEVFVDPVTIVTILLVLLRIVLAEVNYNGLYQRLNCSLIHNNLETKVELVNKIHRHYIVLLKYIYIKRIDNTTPTTV